MLEGSSENVTQLRERIRESVKKAVRILEESPEFAKLIPEVRTNVVEALPRAMTVDEVVGVPGRITSVKGRIVAVAEPDFGASSHMARLVLSLMEKGAEFRAGINLKYSEDILNAIKRICEEKNFVLSFCDRGREPEEVRLDEGKSMRWIVEEAIKNAGGKIPNFIYDLGSWGKEPMIRLFGRDAIEVATLAVEIAKRLA